MKNKKGKFIAPNAALDLSRGDRASSRRATSASSRSTARAKGAYPIMSQTFIDAYQDSCNAGTMDPATATAFGQFIKYGLSPAGQKSAQRLSYAGLPPKILAAAQQGGGDPEVQREEHRRLAVRLACRDH